MKVKKIPMRTCVVCHEKLEKRDLLRIVRNKDGVVSVDLTGKANGRGAYIKKDLTILEKAKQSKALERHLECQFDDCVYEEIKKVIENN